MRNSNTLKASILVLIAVILTGCGGSSGGGGGGGTPPGFVPTADARSPSVGRQWNDVLLDAIRDGFDYEVYFDPGMPPTHAGTLSTEYKWGFALVSIWSSHLDQSDGVMMDISPASLGNIQPALVSIRSSMTY